MRNTLLLAGLFLSLTSGAFGQYEGAWKFGYDVPAPEALSAGPLLGTPDGGVISILSTRIDNSNDGPGSFAIVKFGVNGDRLWERTWSATSNGFGGWAQPADGVVASDGTFYVNVSVEGLGVLLVKFDADGHELFRRPMLDVWTTTRLALRSDGVLLFGGTFFQGALFPYVRILGFDTQGNQLFETEPVQTFLKGIATGPNGQFAAMGSEDWLEEYQWGQATSYDPDGTIRWSRRVSTDGVVTPVQSAWYDDHQLGFFDASGGMHTLANGNAQLGPSSNSFDADGFVLKGIDPAGATLYRNMFVGAGEASGTRLLLGPDGRSQFVVGFERACVDSCAPRATLWKFDLLGQLLWARNFTPAGMSQSYGVSLALNSQDRIVISGVATLAGETGPGAAFEALYDPVSGALIWSSERATEFRTTQKDSRLGLGFDARGNLFTQNQNEDRMVIRKQVLGGLQGTSYCGPAAPNSSGQSGTIELVGSDLEAANNLSLRLADLPGDTFTMLLSSMSQGSTPTLGGGQGTLCLGGEIGRFIGPGELRRTLPDGSTSLQLDLMNVPTPAGPRPAFAGQTWSFQAWFRDANPVATSNLTNAVTVLLR